MSCQFIVTNVIYLSMGKEVVAQIEALAYKGYGITHIDGKVLFVPLSVIKDQGLIEIVEEKKRFSIGMIKELLIPSPMRVLPECNLFGKCGGCQWQHIKYSIQPELKRDILLHILQRLGGLREIPPISIIKSSNPYGYRTRVQIKLKRDRIGFFEMKSHNIVDIDQCFISHPLINQILCLIIKEKDVFSGADEIEINISPDEEKGVLIIKNLNYDKKIQDRLNAILKCNPVIKGIVINKKGRKIVLNDPYLYYKIIFSKNTERGEFIFRVSPGSFYQINLAENQKLVETVIEFSELNHNPKALDLYCGIGNFTIPLSKLTKEIIGIEFNKSSFEDACFNAKQNKISNCKFINGDVEKVLNTNVLKGFNLIILDPPRTGCKGILNDLIKIRPAKIVYVSCEPTTLSRDLKLFNEKGYQLERLSLIDMFPQTYHMEVVALLKSLY